MSFLNAEEPSACDLVADFGINVLQLSARTGEGLVLWYAWLRAELAGMREAALAHL